MRIQHGNNEISSYNEFSIRGSPAPTAPSHSYELLAHYFKYMQFGFGKPSLFVEAEHDA